MSSSSVDGLILGLPATAAALDNLPARTSTWRTVANNWNHTADVRGRTLVSSPQQSTTTGGITIEATADSEWKRVLSFGPFPLLVSYDGAPYRVRLRAGGRSLSSGEPCYLRIGVCPLGLAEGMMTSVAVVDGVLESSVFSDQTNSWRVEGVVAPPYVPFDLAIVNAVASASIASVSAALCTIEVWGQPLNGESLAVTQVYASEYVGIVPAV